MKVWKRIFTSMVRRPYQMLFVFLTVFILGNVLFASIAVQQASTKVKDEMRSRISGEISISYNTDLYRVNEGTMLRMKEFVNEIESNEQEYDYDIWKKINVIPVFNDDFNVKYYSYNLGSLYGTSNFDTLQNGLLIEKGRNYTKEDIESDQFKIVLPYSMEDVNVGDTIKLCYRYYDEFENELFNPLKIIEFEVIGIASNGYTHPTDQEFFIYHPIVPLTYIEKIEQMNRDDFNSLSVDHQKIIQANKKSENRMREDGYLVVDFMRMDIYTEGVDTIEEIKNDFLNNPKFAKAYYTIRSTLSDYLYIQGPLENLVALSNVTLWASVFLVVCILSLVSILFIRTRKYEIGLLMSLGESKIKVMMQFVLEVMIVGLLATSFAMVSGNCIGEGISQEFMKMQIDTEAEIQYEIENGDVVTQLDMLAAYEINFDTEYIITIYLSSTLVLLVSSLLPMLYIVRMKPKEIMLG